MSESEYDFIIHEDGSQPPDTNDAVVGFVLLDRNGKIILGTAQVIPNYTGSGKDGYPTNNYTLESLIKLERNNFMGRISTAQIDSESRIRISVGTDNATVAEQLNDPASQFKINDRYAEDRTITFQRTNELRQQGVNIKYCKIHGKDNAAHQICIDAYDNWRKTGSTEYEKNDC